MTAEGVEAEGEEVAGERVFVSLRELLVAVLEAAGDEEVACAVPASVSQPGEATEVVQRERTKFAEPELANVLADSVEDLLPLFRRRRLDLLLEEERALLVVVLEDAADEGLRARATASAKTEIK